MMSMRSNNSSHLARQRRRRGGCCTTNKNKSASLPHRSLKSSSSSSRVYAILGLLLLISYSLLSNVKIVRDRDTSSSLSTSVSETSKLRGGKTIQQSVYISASSLEVNAGNSSVFDKAQKAPTVNIHVAGENITTITSSQLLGMCQSGIASFKRKYDHRLWCPPWETSVTYNHYANYQLHVIYFLNTKIHNGYGGWMKEQLKYVPPSAALKIVSVANDCENETIMQDMYRNLVASRNGSTLLECHDEAERETFEYHGIHALWETGQMNSGRDDIVFYFHSKGITHYKEWKHYEANWTLSKLAEMTLGEVNLVFEVFDLFPEVNKVGNKMSEFGWVWYNFMFARGSYLKRVAEPIITSNRHDYEAWIANVDDKRLGDGYSHHANNFYKKHGIPSMGTYYNPVDGTWRRWDDKEWKVQDPPEEEVGNGFRNYLKKRRRENTWTSS